MGITSETTTPLTAHDYNKARRGWDGRGGDQCRGAEDGRDRLDGLDGAGSHRIDSIALFVGVCMIGKALRKDPLASGIIEPLRGQEAGSEDRGEETSSHSVVLLD